MSEETKFVSIEFDESRLQDVFAGKDGQLYCVILLTEGTTIIRKREQVKDIANEPHKKRISLPEGFELRAKKSSKNADGLGYTETEVMFPLEQAKALLSEEGPVAFVNLYIPRENLKDEMTAEDGTTYRYAFVPGVGSFSRPSDKFHPINNRDDMVVVYMPGDKLVKVRKSSRVDGVPDDAPNSEKYKNEIVEMSAFEIKEKMVRKAERDKQQSESQTQDMAPRRGKSR